MFKGEKKRAELREDAVLTVKRLKRYFKSSFSVLKAVDDVNLKLFSKEVIGLIGESGSGKTTVGRSLLKLYDDFSGTINLLGRNIASKRLSRKDTRFLRDNIQMIFQDPTSSLNPQHTIYSLLREPLVVNKTLKKKVEDLMSSWHDVIRHYYYKLRVDYYDSLDQLLNLYITSSNILSQNLSRFLATIGNEVNEYLAIFNDNPSKAVTKLLDRLNIWIEAEIKRFTLIIKGADSAYKDLLANFKGLRDNLANRIKSPKEEELSLKREAYTSIRRDFFSTKELLQLCEERRGLLTELSNKKAEKKHNLSQRRSHFKQIIEGFKLEILTLKIELSKTKDLLNFKVKSRYFVIYKGFYKAISSKKKQLEKLDIVTQEQFEKDSFSLIDTLLKMVRKDPDIDIRELKQLVLNKLSKLKLNSLSDRFMEEEATLLNAIDNLRQRLKGKDLLLARFASLKQVFKNLRDREKVLDLKNARRGYRLARKSFLNETTANEANLVKNLRQKQEKYGELRRNFKQNCRILRADLVAFKAKVIAIYLPLLKTKSTQKSEDRDLTVKEKISDFKYKLNEFINRFHDITREFKQNLIEISRLGILHGSRTKPSLLKLSGLLERRAARRIILDESIYKILEHVGLLRQFAYRYPHEFSGGQRQRIAIARALISEPKIIVADEPISSLDISIQAQVINLLRSLCSERGIGIIFIAHDLSVVENIADWVLIMHLGKIVEEGRTSAVFSKPVHPYTINLIESVPSISNAAVPFKANPFINYIEEYDPLNPTIRLEIEKDHFVSGTKDQIKRWVSEAKERSRS